LHITWVFAIAGLDEKTISGIALFNMVAGRTLIIEHQSLSSTFNKTGAFVEALVQ
jgi:hypothetical protein